MGAETAADLSATSERSPGRAVQSLGQTAAAPVAAAVPAGG
jgi:hypothetical protein